MVCRPVKLDGSLVADLCVIEVWNPQFEALFDICVMDTDAQSYYDHTPLAIFSFDEPKKKMCSQDSRDRR